MAKKVLFINQEIDPYVAETHMSIMGRELPQKMQEAGFEIRTFMPKWGTINERRGQLHEVIRLSGMNLIIDDTDHPLIIKVASIPTTRQQIYFIDNDDYFNRRQMAADEQGVEYARQRRESHLLRTWRIGNREEASLAARRHRMPGMGERRGAFHIKTAYAEEPSFANSKVILSLYTNELKAELGTNFKQCVDYRDAKSELLADYKEDFDFIELGKMAIDYSDGVVEGEEESQPDLSLIMRRKNKPVPWLIRGRYPGAIRRLHQQGLS